MASLPLRILALLATLALLPAVDAATFSFGSVVAKTDYDFTPAPEGKPSGLCFLDGDGNGAYSAGEPLYLDITNAACIERPQKDDVRLLPFLSYSAGTSVGVLDQDAQQINAYMGPVTHFLRYFDADGDGKFKVGDTLYIDIMDTAVSKVGVGDVRLTAFGSLAPGTAVGPGDADANQRLANIGAGVGFASANIVYKAGSGYYVNTDGHALATGAAYGRDFVVEENDVRLNAKAENPFGDFNAPAFTVVDATVVSSNIVAGQWLQLKVTMKNTGKAAASGLVETYMDDVLVDSRGTATIAPGKEGSVVITFPAPEETGVTDLRVGKDKIASYFVQAASGATGVSTSSIAVDAAPANQAVEPVVAKASPKGAPGVPLLALLGLVGILAWMRRRAD